MVATRKIRSKGAVKDTEPNDGQTRSQLGPSSTNPPKLFVLPKSSSSCQRILTLQHPRDAAENRYLFCPEIGLFEFTKVSAPTSSPRSWLLAGQQPESRKRFEMSKDDASAASHTDKVATGYVTRGAEIFVATPIDPIFFLLPVICPRSAYENTEKAKRLFLEEDEYWDAMISSSPQLRSILEHEPTKQQFRLRLTTVCDTVDAGDEKMYRASEKKLLEELLRKASRVVENGLPASLEEKFVRKALDVPFLSVKRAIQEQEDSEAQTSSSEATDSQRTTTSTTTDSSEASTAATSTPDDSNEMESVKPSLPELDAPEEVIRLLRLRTALDFMMANYVAAYLVDHLTTILSGPESPINFTPLDEHMEHLAKLRAAAQPAQSFSSKRSAPIDDDWEERAEKQRKLEEDEKRKKAGKSVGVRKLEKANTSGMKKMSDFFKKK